MALTNDLATRIYQSILDGSGDAVNLGSFDRYHPFFHLPHILETFEGRLRIESPAALENAFNSVLEGLRMFGATRMERSCTVAQFDGPDTIRGVHETLLLGDDRRVLEAYSGLCTLRLIEGQWRVAVSQFAEEKASLPSFTLNEQKQGSGNVMASG